MKLVSASQRFFCLCAGLLAAATVLASSWGLDALHGQSDRAWAAGALQKTRTLCVGRFLVDVPRDAEVAFSHRRIHGFALDIAKERSAAFDLRVVARERELDEKGRLGGAGGPGGIVASRGLYLPGLHEDALLALWDGIASSIASNIGPQTPRPPGVH